MNTDQPTPQQEQIEPADENAPALRPWTTPRLQRLNGDHAEAVKSWGSFETFEGSVGPGPS